MPTSPARATPSRGRRARRSALLPPTRSTSPKALHQVKNVLAKEIARTIDERVLTQTEAAWLMKDAPSQISLVVTGKLRGFSTDRLVHMLTGLGRSVEIRVLPTNARGKAGTVKTVIVRG